MKPLAIFLVILVIASLAGVGYLYFTSNIVVSFVSVTATDPVTQPDVFDQVKTATENGAFVGTLYSSAPLTGPEDYLFYTWTVRLENNSFLPADTIEIQVTPMAGDALMIGDTMCRRLASRGQTDLSATLLTARDKHSVREAIVSWYVWGLPFSTRITLGK